MDHLEYFLFHWQLLFPISIEEASSPISLVLHQSHAGTKLEIY